MPSEVTSSLKQLPALFSMHESLENFGVYLLISTEVGEVLLTEGEWHLKCLQAQLYNCFSFAAKKIF